jgi:hypothetical protein
LKTYRALGRPPGPPLADKLFQVRLDVLHDTLEPWADRYGPLYRIHIGSVRMAVLCRDFDVEFADPRRPVEKYLAFTMTTTRLVVRMRRRNPWRCA